MKYVAHAPAIEYVAPVPAVTDAAPAQQLPAAGTSGDCFSRVSCDLRCAGSSGGVHCSSARRNLRRAVVALRALAGTLKSTDAFAVSACFIGCLSRQRGGTLDKHPPLPRYHCLQPKRHDGACGGTPMQEVQHSGGCARAATREGAKPGGAEETAQSGVSVEDARQLCEDAAAEADAFLAAWQHTVLDGTSTSELATRSRGESSS